MVAGTDKFDLPAEWERNRRSIERPFPFFHLCPVEFILFSLASQPGCAEH
jgi:hypothetical protein